MARTRWIAGVGFAVLVALLVLRSSGVHNAPVHAVGLTPTLGVYLPAASLAAAPSTCPFSSGSEYSQGTAFQYDEDNPVRPAEDHADKNLALRGYTRNADGTIIRELVSYGRRSLPHPPQLATLFSPYRAPVLNEFYRVHHWLWAASPNPGARSDPISTPPVTALGLGTTPGEQLRVPDSGYDIGAGMEAIVLFADEDTIALRYTRDDSAAPAGFTLHVDGICTDQNLLNLYRLLDDPGGARYVYPNKSYPLPILYAGQPFGTARGTEIIIAIADTGSFQDPRSCNDWWQVRPDYDGTCPPHE